MYVVWCVLLCVALLMALPIANTQTLLYNITTVVGGGTDRFGNNIPATMAVVAPTGPPTLNNGKLIFVDSIGQVRHVDLMTNILSTLVGTIGNITIVRALSNPTCAKYFNNELYVLHANYYLDRIISTSTRIAGTGIVNGYSGDGSNAISALLNYPRGFTMTTSGDIIFADSENNRIRKISSAGIISTIAGTGVGGFYGESVLATNARLFQPFAVVVNSIGEIYIADTYNHRIRKISTSGTISTYAGTGEAAYSGDGGPATAAKLNNPKGITIYGGEVYFADSDNHRIRKISTSGIISTIAGNGTAGYSGDGSMATKAQLNSPFEVTITSSEIYIADTYNHRIRKIISGTITTIAGTGIEGFYGDGSFATDAQLFRPFRVAVSSSGEIYIADTFNHRIRKISTAGIITTIAGTGMVYYSGDGIVATNAPLFYPSGLGISSGGEVLIADTENHRLRKISTSNIISTIAGGTGDGGLATLGYIKATTFEFYSNGDIYIADTDNHRIRKISSGNITTIAGTGAAGYSGDNSNATSAQLNYPSAVAIRSNHEIYIADTDNHRIRKIASGTITTIAGTGTAGYSGDGMYATSAELNYPSGITVTSNGEIYFSDTNNNRVRKISTSGIITTIAGNGTAGYSGDNSLSTSAQLNNTQGVAISNSTGIIYITDSSNNRIRSLLPWCTENAIFIDGSCENQCFGHTNKNESFVCSGKGVCLGYNNCSCTTHYFGSNCDEFYCYGLLKNQTNVCSSHGSCIAHNKCSCLSGYYGDECQYFYCNSIPFNSSVVCSSKGNCVGLNNCSCNSGYSGSYCQNYSCYGVSFNNSMTCSSHGTCTAPNNCSCVPEYFGSNCNQFNCYGVHNMNATVCSGRGQCSSPNNCTCDSGYYGANCEMYDCYGIVRNNSNVCSGHGLCSSYNNCTCNEGYYDSKCESFNCVGVKFTGQNLCQNNGTCSGPGNCECPKQFGGARCEYFKCFSYAANEQKVCGGHGTCLNYNNCSCADKWFGEDCSVTNCFDITSNSSSVCGSRGNCSDFDKCTCNTGYTGSECEHLLCYGRIESDNMVCSGNGICSSPNNCTCETGYVGNECQYHEIYLNTATAMVFSFHETLMQMLPNNSEIFSCNDIFDEYEIMKFGQNSSISCQWRKSSLKIYLGFDYSIQHYSVIQTKFNFSMRVSSLTNDVSSSTCTFGYSLTEASPLLDIVIRLNCDDSLHGFKKLKTSWTCTQCSGAISSLLNKYSNRTFIHIPISYTNSLNAIQGYKTISLQNSYSSEIASEKSISKEVKLQTYTKSLPPSYYWLSDNFDGKTYSCVGHNCILETSLNSLNSSISYSFSGFFSLLNNDLYSKQMVRMINVYSGGVLDSEFNSNMQVFAVQLKTYVFLPFSIDSFKYSTFTNLDFVMTGVNRTNSINSDEVTVGLTIDDPYISTYTLSDYMQFTWNCSKVSPFNKSQPISENLCSSTKSYLEETDIKKILSLKEGSYLITATISSNKYFTTTAYNYQGYIELLDISNQSPKITTDYIPAITPSHKNIYLRNVVKSSTVVSFKWKLKQGYLNNIENIEEFLESNTISKTILANDIEIILNIDTIYLIEGEVYEFELTTVNSNGIANVSTTTRIDYSPRLSCVVENLKNENNFTSFETLIAINCMKLSYESVSSFVMEFYSNNQRLGIISNTPKKAFISKLPYSYSNDGIVTLVVKLQNLYGSIGTFKSNINVELPSYLLNDNSILSRVNYVSNQYQIVKSSQPLKMEISAEINSLLTLLIQNETLSTLSDRLLKELTSTQITSLNAMLIEMLKTTKSLWDLTYKVDEKVIQLTVPIVYKISNILKTTISDNSLLSTFTTELESFLELVYSGMKKALNYYPTFIYNDLLDSYHLEEIKLMQTILSNIHQSNLNEQYKLLQYALEYFKLTGETNKDNSSFIEDIEYSALLNDKAISLTVSNFKVDMKLPSDFSNQISVSSKSKLFYSITSFSPKTTQETALLQNKPIVDLSLLDTSYNTINVKNINSPIVFKFQGLITRNKSKLNTTCVFYDTTSNTWSSSGLETLTTITKRTVDYLYFDVECKSTHLSVFSIEEVNYNTPIVQPSSSSKSATDSTLIIILSTVLPITFLIVVFSIILIVFIILLVRNKQKKTFEIANTTEVELNGFSSSDFPSEGSMFIHPLMSVSSNGTTSEAFNPLSRYSNLVRIGQGSFGSVFKALDGKTNSVKAIKVIKYSSMEELNNFMKEGTQLMNVNHPYILRVNEFFVSKDQLLCIDMDFYELGDLVKLTNVDFECSEKLIKQIIYQMCQGLNYIHCNMKIIHRDIKPSNIFVKSLENDNIHIIIADFGLAKSDIGASMNNSYAGTPIFMSPELGLGGKYYYNTDIYSLGVTIYQIITKDTSTSISQLYLGKDQNEVTNLLRKKLQDGGQYSERLVELVLSMLMKDNLIRPQAQDILENYYFDDLKKKQ